MPPRPADPTLSCVMPAFNEGGTLPLMVPRVLATLRSLASAVELIVVDDGSRDDTPALMRALSAAHPEVVYLRLSRNFGKEAALSAGIDAARGDAVLLIDADGQHPLELVPQMFQRWREGADMAIAIRKTRDDQSRLQAGLTAVFYRLINWHSRIEIPAGAGDFRLMDRKVVDALKSMPERSRFMKGLYAWVGFETVRLEYEPLARHAGASRFGFTRALMLALTGMLAFSSVPLRVMTFLGLALALAALGYAGWVVVEYFTFGIEVPGYATLVVGLMFFSGIQLLGLGIVAEYVGRIYDEVKQRPSYLVRERVGAGLPPPAGPAA
jgi:glycosyltransferase involved in cell wall biosynthesis